MNFQDRTTRLLSRAVLSCATVLAHMGDPFLARSLEDAIQQCIEAGMRLDRDTRHVARSVADLHRSLEDVSLIQSAPLRALLLAERHVLLLLLHVRSDAPSKKVVSRAPQPSAASGVQKQAAAVARNGRVNGRVTDTMKQVLEGIKKTQPARAKDIIEFCDSLSERTVKRNLTELVRAGYANKSVQNGSVLYSSPAADSV